MLLDALVQPGKGRLLLAPDRRSAMSEIERIKMKRRRSHIAHHEEANIHVRIRRLQAAETKKLN